MSRSRITDFEILNRLGSGSFGTVYKVRRLVDGALYVIKNVRIVELSRKEQSEAINEVQILSQLKSPFVVRYYDSFIEADSLHICMEFCNRGDLQNLLKKAKDKNVACLKENVIWNIFLQITLGLHYLHKKKILHRDLKTANVFLTKDEKRSNYLVKIGDLGVAKLMDTSTAFANTIVGTPYYLSPELCADKPYRDKSDCWALGVLLYECCTLEHPFEARNQCALIMKIIQSPVKPPSTNVSDQLCNMCLWLLQKDPNSRPSTRDIFSELFVQRQLQDHDYPLPEDVVDLPTTDLLSRPRPSSTKKASKRNIGIPMLGGAGGSRQQSVMGMNTNTAADDAADEKPSGPTSRKNSYKDLSGAPRSTTGNLGVSGTTGAAGPPIGVGAPPPKSGKQQVRGDRIRAGAPVKDRITSDKALNRHQVPVPVPVTRAAMHSMHMEQQQQQQQQQQQNQRQYDPTADTDEEDTDQTVGANTEEALDEADGSGFDDGFITAYKKPSSVSNIDSQSDGGISGSGRAVSPARPKLSSPDMRRASFKNDEHKNSLRNMNVPQDSKLDAAAKEVSPMQPPHYSRAADPYDTDDFEQAAEEDENVERLSGHTEDDMFPSTGNSPHGVPVTSTSGGVGVAQMGISGPFDMTGTVGSAIPGGGFHATDGTALSGATAMLNADMKGTSESGWNAAWTARRGDIIGSNGEGVGDDSANGSTGTLEASSNGTVRTQHPAAAAAAAGGSGVRGDENGNNDNEFADEDDDVLDEEQLESLQDLIAESRQRGVSSLGEPTFDKVYTLCKLHMGGGSGGGTNGSATEGAAEVGKTKKQTSFIKDLEAALCGDGEHSMEAACEAVFGIKVLLALEAKYEYLVGQMQQALLLESQLGGGEGALSSDNHHRSFKEVEADYK